jgi:NAD(P)-dependent dehydrogenase (short-subunit alcohol dehydrogenase family)
MAMMLNGKVALVSGAGRGLGRAHALALATAGATVVVNERGKIDSDDGEDVQTAAKVVVEITAAGGKAFADPRDIGSWHDAHQLVDDTVARYGGLDILINNAGVCRTTSFGALQEADWDLIMNVNAKGTAALIDAAARHWQKAGPAAGRAIVNTASPQGAHPVFPIGLYSASKAAVLALTQVAASELAVLGVRVNALAPIARTRMVGTATNALKTMPRDPEFDRFLPEHVAQMVLYLVSPLCPFTGRLFGARGDDAVLFSEWDAAYHANNARRQWTPETLALAFKDVPLQDQRRTFAPHGSMAPEPSPTDATLTMLLRATSAPP